MRIHFCRPRVLNEKHNARSNRWKWTHRRAMVAVQVAVLMIVLLGFAALAIDVGHLCALKGELQRVADAAALAGVSAFADDSLRTTQYGENSEQLTAAMATEAAARTVQYAGLNTANGLAPALGEGDVVVGSFDFNDPTAPLGVGGQPNAVQASARFTEDSPNGAVSNFLAQILGFPSSQVGATATAAFDDRFAGYTPDTPGVLTPFTIYVTEYETQRDNGPDNLSYDEDLDVVQNVGDGIREVRLFPYADEGGGDGAGNFGLLNVGLTNMGVPGLRTQILNGITPEEIEEEIGTSELTFVDGAGNPITYEISGNPGMKDGAESAIEVRVGDVIGFFLHSSLVDGGSTATYTMAGLRFGRLMEVHLTGDPDQRRLVVQPVVYTDPGVRTDGQAPSSGGLIGRLVLVR